ncbi:MAG: metal ABC transporter permease [bacterium]|nr:metal ABC transporter permease [bacterium]
MKRISQEDRRVWVLFTAVVALFVAFIPFSVLAFDVQYTYTLRTVALGGAILGIISGVLGTFAVLRQQSLMGDALSHAALPGVTIAFLLVGRQLSALLIGAGIASWLGIRFIMSVTRTTRIKQDTAMGIVLASWFALGIVLLSYIQGRPDASQAGLDKFIFGQAAAIVRSDVELVSVVGLMAFIVLGLFWKEFKLITFDPEFARANGFPAGMLDTLLSTLIVVAIVLGLQLAGVILMVGMLIAPAVAARQWTRKLEQMVLLSGAFGAFAGAVGAIISAVEVGLPTGPLMIVVASAIVLVSICFAPERGLVWTLLKQAADRRRFAALNALRDLYRHAQNHGDPRYPTPEALVTGLRGNIARRALHQLAREGLAVREGQSWRLTDAGIAQAEQDTLPHWSEGNAPLPAAQPALMGAAD